MAGAYTIERAQNGEIAVHVPTLEYVAGQGFVARLPQHVLDTLGARAGSITVWAILGDKETKVRPDHVTSL